METNKSTETLIAVYKHGIKGISIIGDNKFVTICPFCKNPITSSNEFIDFLHRDNCLLHTIKDTLISEGVDMQKL